MQQTEYARIEAWLRDGRTPPTGLMALPPEKRAKAHDTNLKLREMIKARRQARKAS